MTWFRRHSVGLVGQVVAILLLAIVIEFAASTLLYERASQFAVREDEAHRLAEHLVVSRKIVGDAPPTARPAIVAELTTDRYVMSWRASAAAPPIVSPALLSMRQQIVRWEPTLADSDLRLALSQPGRYVTGGLMLRDRSWLHFSTRQPIDGISPFGPRMTLALVSAFLIMALGGLLIRHTLSPLRRLAEAVDRFEGDDGVVVAEAGPREVRRVTRAFNDLQSRIRTLVTGRTQALTAVSHDLRTPLARLNLRADAVDDPPTRAAIRADVGEMNAMVSSLLAFLGGEDDPDPWILLDVAVLLATIVDARADAGEAMRYIGPDHADIVTRPTVLRRAINNLVDNAVRHGSHVDLTLTRTADTMAIAVIDDGPGIPEAMLAKVVEPFVRLDPARARDAGGFGLGLAIVTRATMLLGGNLILANRPGGGLIATLRMPVAAAIA